MAIKLASLFIEIGADGGKLTAELKKTKAQTKDWSKSVSKAADSAKKSLAAVGVAGGAAAAGLTAVYVANAASLDTLGKTADKLGESAENLKAFQLAAELSGVSSEASSKALNTMNVRLAEAAQGTGAARDALVALGLDAGALITKLPIDAYKDISTALEGVEGAANKAAIYKDIFSKSGVDLVNLNVQALELAESTLNRFGGALSSLEIDRIEAANDSIAIFGSGVDLIGQKFTASLAPAVGEVADALASSIEKTGGFNEAIESSVDAAVVGVGNFAIGAGKFISFLDGRPELAQAGLVGYLFGGKLGFIAATASSAAFDSLSASFDYYKSKFDVTLSDAERTEIALKKVVSRMELLETPGIGSLVAGGDEELIELEETRRALVGILSDMGEYDRIVTKGFQNTTGAAAVFGESLTDVGERLVSLSDKAELITNIDTEKLVAVNDAVNNSGGVDPETPFPDVTETRTLTSTTVASVVLDDDGNTVDPRLDALDDKKHEEDNAIAERAEKDKQERLSQIRNDYFISQTQEAERFENTWTLFQSSGAKSRAKILLNETKGALGILAGHSKKMFAINKAVGLADATVSIAKGISKALELPFPANLGAAATVALQGAAQIKTIASAKYGKADVSTPTSSSSSTTDVSSPNTSVAANDDSATNNVPDTNAQIMVFTSAGASDEQRADEIAQAVALAQESDVLVPNEGGGLSYTGSGTSNYEAPTWAVA